MSGRNATIDQVAPADATVLLSGETGTGKEVIARAIQAASRRSTGPLVRVNCGAVPANLIESEFFGHEKGAFTGATARREGRFQLADGGTIFLDEIGELPVESQPKLLRVLQEGEFEPVGSSRTVKVGVEKMQETVEALKNQPSLAEFQFRSTGRWITGGHNRSMVSGFYGAGQEHTRREPFVFDKGEPEAILGNDTGANPVEYLLVTLAGCTTTCLAVHAAANGITIESIETELEGDMDMRGFLGLAPDVKPGYEGIRIKYRIKSDADEAALRKFIGMSPVCDSVCRPVPLSIEIEQV